MEKTAFLNLLQHYASTSVDEAKALASLRAQYPYSQLIQTLTARASKDHGLQHQQRDLQLAAVYAADRSLLKEIITLQPEEPVQQVVSKHIHANEQASLTIDSVDVADVIMDDLERLSKLKHTFENLFMDYPLSGVRDVKEVKEVNEVREVREVKGVNEVEEVREVEEVKEVKEKREVTLQELPGEKFSPVREEVQAKSKKERIIEMAKALNSNSEAVEAAGPKKKRRDKDGNLVNELIDEIQSSKEEIVPENDRQKQQIEIINQFIRIQPSISNPRDRVPSPIGDLMPIKSGEFGDNIVSETLVEILIKQGKKDRAIEVLKKLIWKYPQKKAYFASQIEDLKK